jgi:hypothetical protein
MAVAVPAAAVVESIETYLSLFSYPKDLERMFKSINQPSFEHIQEFLVEFDSDNEDTAKLVDFLTFPAIRHRMEASTLQVTIITLREKRFEEFPSSLMSFYGSSLFFREIEYSLPSVHNIASHLAEFPTQRELASSVKRSFNIRLRNLSSYLWKMARNFRFLWKTPTRNLWIQNPD